MLLSLFVFCFLRSKCSKFLAIVSSNLDEFFMKRIGGLKQQIAAGIRTPTVDGRTPAEQVKEGHAVVRGLHQRQNEIFRELLGQLKQHDIKLTNYADLRKEEQAILREHFITNIFPLLTPLAMDPGHPFPFISDLSLNLAVLLYDPIAEAQRFARVKIPPNVPRFIQLADGQLQLQGVPIVAPGPAVVGPTLARGGDE